MTKPRVAVLGTGGTIASIGKSSLDILDYGANETMLHVDEIIARFPEVHDVADVLPIRFEAIPSPKVFFPEWKALVMQIETLAQEQEDLAGIVVTHGTASLEETAYFLNLTLHVDLPVVVVGSQRPASALSTDAGMNLVNAVRTAAATASRGLGVLVLLNDEIHAAREVTKTSTYRLQTFRTPDFGVLGHADGDAIAYYRQPVRRRAPNTEFDIRALEALPRVDIVYAYTGRTVRRCVPLSRPAHKGLCRLASPLASAALATWNHSKRRRAVVLWWSSQRVPAVAAPSKVPASRRVAS